MRNAPPLRRLIDLPGVADLEFKALMKPRMSDPDARPEFPEFDEVCRANFGLTADEAAATPDPEDWDGIDIAPVARQVARFELEGWDVTDDKRRPLRVLGHFSHPLWLALRGVAGTLPFQPRVDEDAALKSSLEAEAKAFKRDKV
jgi:hypothetical protein